MTDQPQPQPQPQPTNLDLSLPPELHAGTYADAAMVWHNQHGFTIDFISQWSPGVNDTGATQAEVVARVRVPPSVIFQLARAIAENVDNYERQYGSINSS